MIIILCAGGIFYFLYFGVNKINAPADKTPPTTNIAKTITEPENTKCKASDIINPKDEILNSPFEAVNHFLKIYENKYKLLHIGYRVFLQKI